MTRYLMTGAQAILLDDGTRVEPNSGEFDADMAPAREEFLVKIGAVQKIVPAPLSFSDRKARA